MLREKFDPFQNQILIWDPIGFLHIKVPCIANVFVARICSVFGLY